MTDKQWQLLYQSLVGLSGPLAKFIALFFDLDQVQVKTKLDAALTLIAVLTPVISGVWMIYTSKPSDQLKSVASLLPEQAMAAAAQLPHEATASIANALPDKAIVTAAGALDGVSVVVDKSASVGSMAAAKDPSVPNVNMIGDG